MLQTEDTQPSDVLSFMKWGDTKIAWDLAARFKCTKITNCKIDNKSQHFMCHVKEPHDVPFLKKYKCARVFKNTSFYHANEQKSWLRSYKIFFTLSYELSGHSFTGK